MAFDTKVGSFALNTTTGNQSITGVGFQPKAMYFYFNTATSDGGSDSNSTGFGMAISSSSRGTVAFRGQNGANPTSAGRRTDNTKCLTFIDASGNAIAAADFVSLDADGFTINITTSDSTAYIINYIAFGGTDLTNVAIKYFTTPTGTGNQAQTGVGFQPTAMMVISSLLGGGAAGSGVNLGTVGFASSATDQGAMGIRLGNGVNPQINEKIQKTGKLFTSSNGGGLFVEGNLVSFNADGFTINFTTVSTARDAFALCFRGGQYKVGSFNQATSTGSQAVTGTGFTPTGLAMFSFNNVTTTSIVEDTRHSFGAANSSSSRGSIWFGDQDAASPQVDDKDLDRTKIIKMMTWGTPTTDAAADLTSFDSNGFTLDWTAADATAREIIYMAFGSTPVGGSTFPGYYGYGGWF